MPKVVANGIEINYRVQGEGEPLILIPYLAADNACYAFQVADYAKEFRCISLDPRGAGESDKPDAPYTTELIADDVAASLHSAWPKTDRFLQTVVEGWRIMARGLGDVTEMMIAHPAQRGARLRGLLTRPDLRERAGLQRTDAGLPAGASSGITLTIGGRVARGAAP